MAVDRKLPLLLLALGGLAAQARGEEPKGAPAALERLMRLEGHWVGDARLVIEGKPYSVSYHADFRRTKAGSGLAMEEWFDSTELGAFHGDNLIGYDPFTRKIRWFSVDNMGTTHEHVGEWSSATRFAMEHRGVRGGKGYVERIAMDVVGDTLAVRIVGTLAGKRADVLTGIFRRAPTQSSR